MVRKLLLLIFIISISLNLSAQKKELRLIQKLLDNADEKFSNVNEALNLLESNSQLLSSSEPKYESHYYFLLGLSNQKLNNFNKAVESFNNSKIIEKNSNLNKYTTLINQNEISLTNDMINFAVALNNEEKYEDASKILYLAYSLDKKNNIDYLFYAASSAVNGLDYDNALEYYLKLKSIGYEGITTKYFVTEVATGQEIEVDVSTYDLYKKSKEYTNLREEITKSRLPEIVKNISLIYISKGQNVLAMQAIKDAREISPKDINLILTEADLYIKLGDELKFAELMEEAIEQDPNNAILYYNLGVVNANQGKRSTAIDYYKKSIEIDPLYEASYLNIASSILDGESSIVEEMNSLGTSTEDNRKYDELKVKREQLFVEAIPYLEKLVSINPKNIDAITTLKNIYGTIGDSVNFKKYKDLLESF
jgi:tetratricopeptide (TPR) repeat protein